MKLKKIVAIVLTFCILLSSMATGVFAADNVTVTENSDGSKIVNASSVEEAMEYLAEADSSCTECAEVSADGKWTRKTDCDGKCGHDPAIIVPGILQSQVYFLDDEGNVVMSGGEPKTVEEIKGILESDAWIEQLEAERGKDVTRPKPIMEAMEFQYFFDYDKLEKAIPSMIKALVKAIATKDTASFADYVSSFVDDNLSIHYFNDDGTRNMDTYLVEYWYSLEEAAKKMDIYNYFVANSKPEKRMRTEAEAIYHQVDTKEYAQLAGADHLYFYTYPSFGDTYESAERLNQFIQMVKTETGHAKVNLVFISLGGTIGTAYFDAYCNTDDVNKVIFASSALDGSSLLGDLFAGDYAIDDNELMLTDLFPDLFRSFLSNNKEMQFLPYLLNILLRLVPSVVGDDIAEVATQAIQTVVDNFLSKCPSMWSLIPSERYEELAERYLSSEEDAELKVKTDRYYQAQTTNKTRLPYLNDNTDMTIFVVCGYGLHLPGFLNSYYTLHSDSIIESESQSAGAYFAPIGEKLPDDYVPAIDDSYISPDGIVDAGAGYLPNNTWFVYGQGHMMLQDGIHDYISMCINIVLNDDITDARENNGGYPQFNNYRYTKSLATLLGYVYTDKTYTTLKEKVVSTLTAEQVAELEVAAKAAADALTSKTWDPDVTYKAQYKLVDLLVEYDLMDSDKAETSSSVKTTEFITKIFKIASELVGKFFGYKSFFG